MFTSIVHICRQATRVFLGTLLSIRLYVPVRRILFIIYLLLMKLLWLLMILFLVFQLVTLAHEFYFVILHAKHYLSKKEYVDQHYLCTRYLMQ